MKKAPPDFPHLLSFATDTGFKRAFADEDDTCFARRAIQILASLDEPIEHLVYHRNEKEPLDPIVGRGGLIDVLCSDEKRNIFILEMQTGHLKVLLKRLFFYVLHEFQQMVGKGVGGFDEVKPIYCICIINGKLLDSRRLYHEIRLKNQDEQTVFDWVSFYIIELGKFDKTKEACDSDLDKLLFTMKNGHTINLKNPETVPSFWQEEWLELVVNKLKSANLTQEERLYYEKEWILAASAKANELEWERELEKEKVAKMAERKAKLAEQKAKLAQRKAKELAEKRLKNSVLSMGSYGMADDKIAELLDLPLEFVRKIREDYDKEA